VESRAPLLDMRLHRFLLRVPPVPLCIDKELLRRTTRGFLPEEVRLRKKEAFRGDLLGFQIENSRWSPLPLPEPSAGIGEFVDWPLLKASIESARGEALWRDLRPFSLLYWLVKSERHQEGGSTQVRR